VTGPSLQLDPPDAMVVIKAGVHDSEGLASIIERKQREEAASGACYWGYGGTLCDPIKQVQPFAARCAESGITVAVVMPITPSPHHGEGIAASELSTDRSTWLPIPPAVRVTGSTKALVFRDLRWTTLPLDLAAYDVAAGSYAGRPLTDYLRHRIDKACARLARSPGDAQPTQVLVAELVAPYAVYVRT
jgi:hypothetical protein